MTFAFYGLFRISNLVPQTKKSFDITRDTLVRDVLPTKGGLQVLIKWTKTRQAQATFALIPLPTMDDHYMCPVQAWDHYCAMYPAHTQNPLNPLLVDPTAPTQHLTASQARSATWPSSPPSGTHPTASDAGEQRSYSSKASLSRIYSITAFGPARRSSYTSGRISPRHPQWRSVFKLQPSEQPAQIVVHTSLEEHFSLCHGTSPTEHFRGAPLTDIPATHSIPCFLC